MPVVHTVPQLIEASVGAAPEAFRAKIKRVFKTVTGTGQYGPWKLQNLIITDGQAEIMCTFADRDEVPMSAIGQQLYACATSSDKGMNGIKRKASKKDQKPEIWVSAAAEVTFEGGPTPPAQTPPQRQTNGNGSHAPANTPANGNGNGQHAPAAPANPPPAVSQDVVMKAFEIRLGRTSAALGRCFDASIALIKDVNACHNDILGKPSFQDIKDVAMGMLVNAAWNQKPGETEGFPTRPFHLVRAPRAQGQNPAPPQRQGAPFET
jgi:hypothetical protein